MVVAGRLDAPATRSPAPSPPAGKPRPAASRAGPPPLARSSGRAPPRSSATRGAAVKEAPQPPGGGSTPGKAQPPLVHAPQQLGRCPTQTCPPFGALHAAALPLMLHFVAPLPLVRQQ